MHAEDGVGTLQGVVPVRLVIVVLWRFGAGAVVSVICLAALLIMVLGVIERLSVLLAIASRTETSLHTTTVIHRIFTTQHVSAVIVTKVELLFNELSWLLTSHRLVP